MGEGQRMWDAAIAAARLIHEDMKRQRAEKKAASLERRRQRYAAAKGNKSVAPKKAVPLYDPEPPTSCYCSACRMPPCSWCENGAPDAD